MSSSSPPAQDSRSPSPHTPHTPHTSDPPDTPMPPWLIQPLHHHNPAPQSWLPNSSVPAKHNKLEDEQMLGLDDILDQNAFDDSTPAHIPHNPMFPIQQQPSLVYNSSNSHQNQFVSNFGPTNILVPSCNAPISVTKPIPPPAPLPRKLDNASHNQQVVHPPKEDCLKLPIMFPSLPERGAKSRVETQVRVTVDLAGAIPPPDSQHYDRVGSWKWLKLPPGTSTKRRTRKQGKIDASPQDTLKLFAEVVCASAPGVPVLSCGQCRNRETVRVAKKIAARVRPVRSDSESAGEDSSGNPIKKPPHEDPESIIQFNCAEVLDFSTGSVVLPLRLTCYCRHHREKVGFLVHFTMIDHQKRVVGEGFSKPIMITDDHKTASASNRQVTSNAGHDWSRMSPIRNETSPSDSRAPSRRKVANPTKRRPKPYDPSTKLRDSREGSASSGPSPSTVYSPLPATRSPTPSVLSNLLAASEAVAQIQSQTQTPNIPALQSSLHSSDTSSPDILSTPLDQSCDALMPAVVPQSFEQQQSQSALFPLQMLPSLSSPPISQQPQPHAPLPIAQPTPAMLLSQAYFFNPNQNIQSPIIHRLIPNMGPTFGGIEVTVLGAHFYADLNLRCVFGDVVANSTHRWSDNTLVCMLPPTAQPGVVAVWFEGILEQGAPPSLFTYSDESDRALMELALQVVGLKMTGKIEDAKNVAMRIVGGTAGNDGSESHGGTSNLMQLANSSSSVSGTKFNRDLRTLLFTRAGENENFENTVIDFLKIIDTPLENRFAPGAISTADAISYPTTTGQTLLHLAVFMKLPALVNFLLKRHADIDVRDRNGYTPLHFAALSASEECARILVEAGADRAIVNAAGKTAEEIAPAGLFDNIVLKFSSPFGDNYQGESDDGDVESETNYDEDDEEADWGDAEGEDSDDEGTKVHRGRFFRKGPPKRSVHKSTPPPVSVNASGRSTPRRSVDISRAATPPPSLPLPDKKVDMSDESLLPPPSEKAVMDAKQTASIIDFFQRTFSQLPPAAGILPNRFYLNKPQLPPLPKNLPEFAHKSWNSIPQIPLILIPIPTWFSFRSVIGDSGTEEGVVDSGAKSEATRENMPPSPGEWKAFWEKWMTMAIVTTAKQQQQDPVQSEDMPPPEYTPRAEETPANIGSQDKDKALANPSTFIATDAPQKLDEQVLQEAPVTTSPTSVSRPHSHPVGYDNTPVPAEEVAAYTYQPLYRRRREHDRMLLVFWLPILILSVIWAFHNGLQFVYSTFRTALPLAAYLRGNA